MRLWLEKEGEQDLVLGEFIEKANECVFGEFIEKGDNLNLDGFIDKLDGLVRAFKFNRIVSSFMEFYNKNKNKVLTKDSSNSLSELLRVFVPGF